MWLAGRINPCVPVSGSSELNMFFNHFIALQCKLDLWCKSMECQPLPGPSHRCLQPPGTAPDLNFKAPVDKKIAPLVNHLSCTADSVTPAKSPGGQMKILR